MTTQRDARAGWQPNIVAMADASGHTIPDCQQIIAALLASGWVVVPRIAAPPEVTP